MLLNLMNGHNLPKSAIFLLSFMFKHLRISFLSFYSGKYDMKWSLAVYRGDHMKAALNNLSYNLKLIYFD